MKKSIESIKKTQKEIDAIDKELAALRPEMDAVVEFLAKGSIKHYTCQDCGYDRELETNHTGHVYGYGDCPQCNEAKIITWVCVKQRKQKPKTTKK